MSVHCLDFSALPDGRPVALYLLDGHAGVAAAIMTYGSTLVRLCAPDRHGRIDDVILGFDTLAGYLAPHPYFGGTIGRYANRIAHGRFTLDGNDYALACNNGLHHLHGGRQGYDRRLWTAWMEDDAVVMRYVSPDGEEGYPGRLVATVRYALEDDTLRMDYEATCDRPTLVNFTNHAYFNLTGRGTVHEHVLTLPGPSFLPVDDTLIPLGALEPVTGTPFDFTGGVRLAERLDLDDPQLRAAGGYDHTWTIASAGHAARLWHPHSDRRLDIVTTQPGIQFYGGHLLDGTLSGKNGERYVKHAGLCLEPQRYPDSPHHPAFPAARLAPGACYRETTLYRLTLGPTDRA